MVDVGTTHGTAGRTHPTITPLAVGAIIWLASELMFFGGLFAAFFTLRAANEVWPPADVFLEVERTGIFTVLLVASSVTMHFAVVATHDRNREKAARWLAVTFILGTVFIVNQGLEWASFDFGLDSHAYGSIFYILTGFHGLHVIGGLVLMLAVGSIMLASDNRAPYEDHFRVTGYYWHFVDVVWVIVYLSVYVLQ